ncbi:thaumatin-like protein [Rhizoctonia solani]|nr:thaumatin-like protein [Rhizoctonia solani]
MKSYAALAVLSLLSYVEGRTFTVRNACPFTIWPAVYTDLKVGTAVPDIETGWEAPANSSRSFHVPDNWKAGRIWGRRDCNFSVNPGPNSCITGGCNGGLLCDNTTGTGVPPATLAEWTLSGDGNRDFYDVSLVDGYNLPMAITTSSECPVADCPTDLAPNCPAELMTKDANGLHEFAQLLLWPIQYTRDLSSSGIQFYDYFKKGCPNSYVYAYDESSNTALWTCDSTRQVDYTLTFCPPS